MEFRWIDWNIAKVQSHGLTPEEAEFVVEHAELPYPIKQPNDKYLVWGRTDAGRLIQVVFLYDSDENDVVFVIHARPLTARETKQVNRRKRRRGG